LKNARAELLAEDFENPVAATEGGAPDFEDKIESALK
jgi:hypothetical protein